jgi:hypothetical protein
MTGVRFRAAAARADWRGSIPDLASPMREPAHGVWTRPSNGRARHRGGPIMVILMSTRIGHIARSWRVLALVLLATLAACARNRSGQD